MRTSQYMRRVRNRTARISSMSKWVPALSSPQLHRNKEPGPHVWPVNGKCPHSAGCGPINVLWSNQSDWQVMEAELVNISQILLNRPLPLSLPQPRLPSSLAQAPSSFCTTSLDGLQYFLQINAMHKTSRSVSVATWVNSKLLPWPSWFSAAISPRLTCSEPLILCFHYSTAFSLSYLVMTLSATDTVFSINLPTPISAAASLSQKGLSWSPWSGHNHPPPCATLSFGPPCIVLS